ncbi:prepilin peptidase [Aminobacter aganoensis]|uniref:Prepilin peptidase CpaA n=1 Tax=Aminobacter aganoensis TaxID=83264 RepID=A0A7X0F6X3_9HYPH|nr:prepilin peptidase [Aminobacter aganoensis]MBB6354140.1 prepilin peptidase CpaA [Aminobacter aganoensis]
MLEALIFVVFPFCMVYSAVSDTMSMTIANRVPLLLLGVFLVVAPLTGMAWVDIGMHLAAGALLLTVTFAMFALGGMGGGDAKLIAASAVWMGLGMPLMQYLLVSAVFGGMLTLAILAFRSSVLAHITSQNMFLRNFSKDAGGVPYGIALGIGGLLTYPSSPLMLWALERLAAQ